jgi:triosephosphate isomerase
VRTKFIAGNWKMHKTIAESVALVKELHDSCKGQKKRVMIAPPFTALFEVSKTLKGSNILLGAQNMACEVQGAHTGEISPLMLKDIGVSIVIIGHSERRHVYGESDTLINKKVKLAFTSGLEVILCVGEKLDEREAGKAEKVVEDQLKNGLSGITNDQMKNITIAYEPVWAIGTGKNATPEDADAMHKSIRKLVGALYNKDISSALIIQYGGSVNPGNIKALMAMENLDGALVGGASLKSDTFLPIVKFDE